jgi:maltooligosyltrehalose trehalohydrolase
LEQLCGMDAAKVAIGLVLMAPYVPMLFMGEEFAASTPFQYFADHDDEEMRKLVADGRKRDFAQFGFGDDVPNPEEIETFQRSKLNWDEIGEGKHAEMLAWVKSVIKLRRCTICLNDGSMQHLIVSSDEGRRTLVMVREAVRIVANLGEEPYVFDLLGGETLTLVSREGLAVNDGTFELPGMTLAVFTSPMEEVEDREVH